MGPTVKARKLTDKIVRDEIGKVEADDVIVSHGGNDSNTDR